MKRLLFLKGNKDDNQNPGNDLLFRRLKTARRTDKELFMNEKAICALCDSYEHPWHKIQRKIEFIQEKKRLSNFLIEEQGI